MPGAYIRGASWCHTHRVNVFSYRIKSVYILCPSTTRNIIVILKRFFTRLFSNPYVPIRGFSPSTQLVSIQYFEWLLAVNSVKK